MKETTTMNATLAGPGPSPVTEHESPVTIQHIPLAQLRESPLNARRNFNPEKLQELAESIRQKGILTPLLVRPRHYELASKAASEPDMTYEILAGARRFRAAKSAGLHFAPCVAREVDDATALEIITIENLQREDLSALEQAQGFQALLALGKYDVAELAKRVGKSASYIYQRVKLVELAPEAQKALIDQKITAGHAILIARLQPQEQKRALGEAIGARYGHPRSVRDLGDWIQEEIHLDLGKAPWAQADALLVPKAGACTVCPKKEKNACLDPQCYESKMRAHFAQVERKAGQADARAVFKISSGYQDLKEGVYGTLGWRPAKPDSCPAAAIGLAFDNGMPGMRDAPSRLARGAQIGVCIDKKCKIHWKREVASGGGYKRPAAEVAKESARRKELDRRGRWFRALTEKPYSANEAERRSIVDWMAQQLDHDHAKRLCDAMGWPPVAVSYGGKSHQDALHRRLKAMKISEAERWMLWLVVADEDLYYRSYEGTPKPELLAHCAKRAKVKAPPQSHASAKRVKAAAKPRRKKKAA